MMTLKFFYIVGGIFFCYFLFGMCQEKLLRGTFGDNDRFTFVMPLLWITSVFSWLYCVCFKTFYPYTVEKPIPVVFCVAMSLLHVLSMGSSFMALQWVSYPAQVLAKSSKPIPVMLMGVLLGEKHYPLKKYCTVFLVVLGVTAFFYNSDKAANSNSSIGIGEILLIMSLLMDGFLNSLQERMMTKYKPNSNYLMLETNKWIILLSLLISVMSGDAIKCANFLQKYPNTIGIIVVMSLCGAFGQYFIYKGIIELGTLTVSLVTTTRKFFTVLASVIIFGHTVLLRQWFGVLCVFSGLILDTYLSKAGKKAVIK